MKPNRDKAEGILRSEFSKASKETISPEWAKRFRELSDLVGNDAKTIIAVLGTQLLAKATNPDVNAFALQQRADVNGSFSARGLCTYVMAEVSLELGIDLGVRSREPHNNQPFFGRPLIDESILEDVRNHEAFDFFLKLLSDLEGLGSDPDKYREILRTFIYVRTDDDTGAWKRREGVEASIAEFTDTISQFVADRSESGRRAQAIAVGLLDVLATSERVEVGRINDPDRHLPGDVAVRDLSEAAEDVRVWEVRDKPVEEGQARFSVQKCVEADGGKKLAILAVSANQPEFETKDLISWAEQRGVLLRIYFGWHQFVEECLFWSAVPTDSLIEKAHERIHIRLKDADVSDSGIKQWSETFSEDET